MKTKQPQPYTNIPLLPLEDQDKNSRHGAQFFRNVKQLEVGFGAKAFRVDRDGMWSGDETFDDAPWKVDWDGNMIVNSLRRADFHWTTFFESLDGYSLGGSVSLGVDILLTTGVNLNDQAFVRKTANYITDLSWNKHRAVKMGISVDQITDYSADFVTGAANTGGSPTARRIGFRLQSQNILGACSNGTSDEAIQLATMTAGTKYTLSYIYTPNGDVKFYVDGVLKGTLSTYLPSGTTGANDVLYCKINNNSSGTARRIRLGFWDMWQEK